MNRRKPDVQEKYMDDERSRKFHWVDPHQALDVARKVGGLEYTRMVMRGEVPPAPVCELWQARASRLLPSTPE